MTEVVVEGLRFSYPDGTAALDGIDLTISSGERCVIVGQNGSGKSTLVRHLVGLLRPTEGRILIDGADIRRLPVARLARSVGLAFQDPDQQIFSGRVRTEVEFGPRNMGMTEEDRAAAVAEALEAVGLTGQADTNPYDLGYSRRKLLGIAAVLAMRTPVVILDEPTTGQDVFGQDRVQAIIQSLPRHGRTVIAVTHDMRFAAEAFARVVVMRSGRVILDGPPEVVFAEQNWGALASTYLDPPFAAHVGARLGLGSTPTEPAVVAALRVRERSM